MNIKELLKRVRFNLSKLRRPKPRPRPKPKPEVKTVFEEEQHNARCPDCGEFKENCLSQCKSYKSHKSHRHNIHCSRCGVFKGKNKIHQCKKPYNIRCPDCGELKGRKKVHQCGKPIHCPDCGKFKGETHQCKNHHRHNIHCSNCGEFKGKTHQCKIPLKKEYGWYRCSRCKKYLPYEQFQKDSTKKYGIDARCKQCRQETGNGNRNRKIR